MSLLYTMRALNPEKYKVAVALVQPEQAMRSLYEKDDFPVFEARGLTLFQHSTARWARLSRPRTWLEPLKSLLKWRDVKPIIEQLQQSYQPDIIHLNSVVLAPVADFLLKEGIPFIWHVRESPVKGYLGVRLAFVRRILRRAGERVIFLSETDKKAWVENSNGTVVHNFMDIEAFELASKASPKDLIENVDQARPNMLYLGGMTKIKGFMILLDALKILKDSGLEVNCLCPGTMNHGARSRHWWVEVIKRSLVRLGVLPYWMKCERRIKALGLSETIYKLPFITEIAAYYGISDCLVFPAIEPHFARPVIEAQACGIPVVASHIDGVTELMEGVECGLMVPVGDAAKLAAAIRTILTDQVENVVRAENGRINARDNFDSKRQILKVENLYEQQANFR